MIDTQSVITDAELLAAFDSGPVKSGVAEGLIPAKKMAESLRHVADMVAAAYADQMRRETIEAINALTERLGAHLNAE